MVRKGEIGKDYSVRNVRDRKANSIKMFSIAAVLLMVLSAFCVIGTNNTDDIEASISDYDRSHLWKCVLVNGGDGKISTEYYTRSSTSESWSGGSVSAFVRAGGASTNSIWYFSKTSGYGPFNSFYAAFDTSGRMACHLDPYDLSRSVDTSDGTNYANGNYNIMWVLPRIYANTDNGHMVFTNDSSLGYSVYEAFVNGSVNNYSYIAYGVYEASVKNNKLYSVTKVTPTSDTTLNAFRTYANNNDLDQRSPGIETLELLSVAVVQILRHGGHGPQGFPICGGRRLHGCG